MKPQSYDCLIKALLDHYYFPRKKPNQLCCVVDTFSELVYPVPAEIEHVDFVSLMLDVNVKSNHDAASHIVPSSLRVDVLDRTVKSLVTGVSGMEIGYDIRHTRGQLEKAHSRIRYFVNLGEFSFSIDLEERVVYKYCIRQS